ncbi:MAG: hypothetical protein ACOCUH_01450 [Bacteriovoracia bacterium]
MRLFLLIVMLLSMASVAYGGITTEGFKKRFYLEKDVDGEVVAIYDKALALGNFSIKPALTAIAQNMDFHRQKISSKNKEYFEEINSLNQLVALELEKALKDSDDQELKDALRQLKQNSKSDTPFHQISSALGLLPDINFKELFSKENIKKVFKEFKKQMKLYFQQQNVATLARLDNPRYYYTQQGVNTAVRKTLEFARRKLDNIPLLNLISYIIVRTDRLIHDRRLYHQYMLKYYLERFDASELGLTKDEADRAMSSIYEAQIPLMSIRESNYAVRNWMRYGFDKFYMEVRRANTRARDVEYRYDRLGRQLGFAFQRAYTTNGKRYIIHLLNNKHMLSQKPAVAYNFDHPYRIVTIRILLGVAKIGVNFLPISDKIKGYIDRFVDSIYAKQRLTEGALFAYMESHERDDIARIIQMQTVNPYDLYVPLRLLP